jgi:hypothetical protein
MANPLNALQAMGRFHRSVKAGGGYRGHLRHFGVGFRQNGVSATLRKAFTVAVWGMQVPRDSRDVVLLHESGYVFVAGWTDPRRTGGLALRLLAGGVAYKAVVEPCRYSRPDVDQMMGFREGRAGFMVLLKGPPLPLRSEVKIWLNGKFTRQHNDPAWLTREALLFRTLEAMAPLFAGDADECAENARRVIPVLAQLWREVVDGISYVPLFKSHALAAPQASLVVVVEGSCGGAMPQLHFLAGMLKARRVELILVHDGEGPLDALRERVSAFAELHGVDVALYGASGTAGVARARNKGAVAARSDNLFFMDAGVFPAADAEPRWHAFFDVVPELALRSATLRGHNGQKPSSSPLWGIHRKTFDALGGLPLEDVLACGGDETLRTKLEERGGRVEAVAVVDLICLDGVGETVAPLQRSLHGLKQRSASRTSISADGSVDFGAFAVSQEAAREFLRP